MKGAAALLLLVGLATGQGDAERAEQALYQALRQGLPENRVLALCQRVCAEHPDRVYPRIVLGDTLYRLRRLQGAVTAYDQALSRMAPAERAGDRGRTVERNRREAGQLLDQIRHGRSLERRAAWVGWTVLLGLITGVLWLGFRRRP